MPKQPLTPNGVKDKIAEVYALPTIDRMAEATAVETNFKTWISDNFTLSVDEGTYLSGINNTVATKYGDNCAIAFRNLLGIALIQPTPRTPPTKWLKMTNNILMATNDSGSEEYTGSLTFEYEYR